MKIHKVLALPPSLEEDSIYFVKNGTGADLYIVDNDGSAVKASSGVDYGLTLGETSSTAYQGDRGKFAYDHALSPHVTNQTDIGLGHVNNTSDLNKPISTATQAALDALIKDDVGLGNVDNTSDVNKPVSTAQQAALDALTKDDVGLGNVDNTSDINKPVSTAQQAAIDAAGGSSFDQDLNTTDSPTFATLTTTDTIATDVYAVDVGATGTLTATNLNVTDAYTTNIGADYVDVDQDITTTNLDATGTVTAGGFATTGSANFNFALASLFQVGGGSFYGDFGSSGLTIKRGNGLRFATTGSIDGGLFQSTSGNFELGNGTSGNTSGSLSLADIDATGTVTAGDVTSSGTIYSNNIDRVDGNLVLRYNGSSAIAVRSADILVYKTFFPQSSSYDLGKTGQRWGVVYAEDVDATGTVTAGGFVGTPQTLTDAAAITYDLANGHNAKVTLTDDRILLFPTNIAEGASGVLTVTQDGTGGRALTFGSGWFISAGAAADISALGAGEKAQVTWYAHSSSDVNATILPLQ